ncbi:MAG: hypothetical protein WCR77_03125 [Bacilli bacterium]|jgi:hypothetical protein|nr:hypothetical protein [Bacilli bacterium]
MKKEDAASLIVYALMIGLALFIGLGIIKPVFEANPSVAGNQYTFAIISVIIGVFLNAVLLELGHILGGLIGKYRIQSVNIFGLCFYKKEGKVNFAFKMFDGLTGETKFLPKSEKSNPKPATLLPVLIYLLELVAAIILYALISTSLNIDLVWLSIGSIIVASIGGMMTLYNIVPFKLDAITDGYRLTLFSKKINITAYNELMLAENGDEPFTPRVFEEITDFTAEVNLVSVYRNIKDKRFADAESILGNIIANEKKTSTSTHNRSIAQLLYLKIMNEPLEDAKEYYKTIPSSIQRFIANDLSMPSLRAYLLIAGLMDDAEGEIMYCLDRKKKAIKYTAPGIAEIEDLLFKEALDKVKTAHPDWKTLE